MSLKTELLRTEDVSDARFESAPPQHPAWQMAGKRALDVLVAAGGLVLLSPFFALISILIKVTSPGPIFFPWRVVGLEGKPFLGYKFRSMFNGADRAREELEDKNEMTGIFFKMKNDPRVTPIGRFLRRFSFDELPQLWSVFAGKMSLVGPRPCQVFEHEKLTDWQKQRVHMRPGCVSLWIVSGKTQDFDEMVRLDLHYIYNWSIWVDFWILFRAIPYVLLGKNQ